MSKKEDEIDFNRKNREDFEHLMEESSTNLDGYYDKKNPVVRLVLFMLGVVILVGVLYYILVLLSIL